ncbi:unnamed protein product [Anisakis simplex]|uniref:Uncharacterized protein n=1 Tax=Anisakis simplex TaxID=6269 RepID=A0A3P6NNU5_ANISI|nr:unnamed protein product [Anisakis simplex]
MAHYSNSGGSFALRAPIWARRLSVVSRKPLSVIDVSVQPCNSYNHTLHASRSDNFHRFQSIINLQVFNIGNRSSQLGKPQIYLFRYDISKNSQDFWVSHHIMNNLNTTVKL